MALAQASVPHNLTLAARGGGLRAQHTKQLPHSRFGLLRQPQFTNRGSNSIQNHGFQKRKNRPSLVSPRAVATPPISSPHLPLPPAGHNRLHELYEKGGQSPWIDNLTRDWAASGHLEELVKRGVRGLTSNPTIFEKAIGGSEVYDGQIIDLIQAKGLTASDAADLSKVEEVYWEIAKTDISQAAGIMEGLYEQAKVSPALAHDSKGTAEMARHLDQTLQLPNLMVKIPATREGLPAIKEMISEGRNINVTLIFSLSRYADVIEAYLSGLEALLSSPHDDVTTTPGDDVTQPPSPALPPLSVSSVASFFLSRVDTLVDARLEALGTPRALGLRGKGAVAQGVMAYQLFREKFSGPRWEKLAQRGARVQRPLWASTGVKNKAYPDTLYVDSLIGPYSVNTLPDGTLIAFAEHGKVARTVDAHVEEARNVLADLAALGIDMEEVAQELEADGVKKFADSFDSLLKTLQGKIGQLAT